MRVKHFYPHEVFFGENYGLNFNFKVKDGSNTTPLLASFDDNSWLPTLDFVVGMTMIQDLKNNKRT